MGIDASRGRKMFVFTVALVSGFAEQLLPEGKRTSDERQRAG